MVRKIKSLFENVDLRLSEKNTVMQYILNTYRDLLTRLDFPRSGRVNGLCEDMWYRILKKLAFLSNTLEALTNPLFVWMGRLLGAVF
jgi:hypothetical protein